MTSERRYCLHLHFFAQFEMPPLRVGARYLVQRHQRTVCTLDGTADGRNPEMGDRKSGKIMAANEIPMAGYQSRLLSRVEVAQDTLALHIEKPSGFDFKPGQSVDLTLINPVETDSEGNTRTFSIASATFENELIFATRIRDTAFKRSLRTVALGTVVKMDAAMGSFTLYKNSAKPAVFLAIAYGSV
jgi:hypothetical protein